MVTKSPPPCCTINAIYECVTCGWKVCASHWYDENPETIMDEWHIPTVEISEDDDTGRCFCGGMGFRYART